MFNLDEIKELIKLIDESTIHEFEIEKDNTKIAIRKPNRSESLIVNSLPASSALYHPAQVPALSQPPQAVAEAQPAAEQLPQANVGGEQPVETDKEGYHKIQSPMVGTFYAAPAPGAEPFVSVGSKVNEKTVVCIVEAMKLMNEIEAEVKGEIVEVLVENGQLVEYGQPLFLVKKE